MSVLFLLSIEISVLYDDPVSIETSALYDNLVEYLSLAGYNKDVRKKIYRLEINQTRYYEMGW